MTGLDRWGNDFERRPWRTTLRGALAATLIVLACLALVGLATTGSALFKGESAKLTNRSREKAIVFDPNRSLATYEGFYHACTEFNANILKAADADHEAKDRQKHYDADADPFGQDRKSINAVREDARALRNQARNLAATYNADSSANTRAPFKAADLPYTLDAAGQEKADCGTPKEGTR